MPGKRKRNGAPDSGLAATAKPLSAIAAARLRLEGTAKGITTPEITLSPVSSPLSSPGPVSESEDEHANVDHHLIPVKRSAKLCNWLNESSNILSDTHSELTINLNKHTTVAVIGCFDLRVLRGAVHINGANIGTVSHSGQKNTTYRMHVPATHPILKIRGLDATNHVQFFNCKEPTPLAGINPLFMGLWNKESREKPHRSFQLITDSSEDLLARPLNPELAPEDWLRSVEDCTSTPSITLITGPAGSGKTTFTKRLLNRYLTGLGKTAPPVSAVCLLDLDPAKQEHAPAGQISLILVRDVTLSPNYTHPAIIPCRGNNGNELLRAHPIPMNLTNYMDYFELCVEDLYVTFKNLQARDKSLSLIIHMPSLLYTSGFDILTKLLTRIKAHNIIHLSDAQTLDTDGATRLNLLKTTALQYRGTVHDVNAQCSLSTPMRSDAELRSMQMQSYFHLKASSTNPSEAFKLSWMPRPLSHLVPWELCYQETQEWTQDIVGFAMYTEPLEPASLVSALVGSIVQIVQSTSSAIPSPYTSLPRTCKYQIPYFPSDKRTGLVVPLDPRTSTFICTAMIRDFDPERRVLRLLVPTTHDLLLHNLLPERTVLISGCCEMPEWAFLEDAYAKEAPISPYDCASNGSSARDANWVERESVIESTGYLDTVRRVRKFQT